MRNNNMPKAIFETKDKQLIPLDDIQHINGRPNESVKEGYQTLTILYKDGMKVTILYKDGMKVTIPATEYERLYTCWEARRNGKR